MVWGAVSASAVNIRGKVGVPLRVEGDALRPGGLGLELWQVS
jgi:hypothetical protein